MADNGQRHTPRNRQHKDRPIIVDGRCHEKPLPPRRRVTKFCVHPEHKSYTPGVVVSLMRQERIS